MSDAAPRTRPDSQSLAPDDDARPVTIRAARAFLAAEPAGLRAGLERQPKHELVAAGAPRAERVRGRAGVGAIEVQADALRELLDHGLGETGVGAGRAGGGLRRLKDGNAKSCGAARAAA